MHDCFILNFVHFIKFGLENLFKRTASSFATMHPPETRRERMQL